MQGAIGGILVGSLLHAAAATAGGYYLDQPGGRNVVWPPPGGLYRVEPPLPKYPPPAVPGYSGPANDWWSNRYYPGYQRRDFVRPPGPEWPGTLHDKPVMPGKPKPLEPGHPVEVIPPPGIPVDHVKQPLTDKPQRGWRPVPGMGGMTAAPPRRRGQSPRRSWSSDLLPVRSLFRPIRRLHRRNHEKSRPRAAFSMRWNAE